METSDKRDILEAIASLAQYMDGEFAKVRNEMATKDFVDRRISDAVAEIAPTLRQVDAGDSALIGTLANKEVITTSEAKILEVLSPFAA